MQMQTPILIFDHQANTAVVIPAGPSAEKRLSELAATQREQIATSGNPKTA